MSRPAPCRAFEERLVHALDRSEARWPLEALCRGDEHLAECDGCRSLVAVLEEDLLLLSRVAPAVPPAGLPGRLAALFGSGGRGAKATDGVAPAGSRDGAEEVLGLLTPGVLARPELSERLRERLARIPAERARGRVVSIEAARQRRSRGGPLSLLSDWRVAVALAYAATLLIVLILRLDPLSTARSATADLTTAGEQAITAARSAAEKRIADVRSRGSLRDQLDYRLYRAMAVGKARATAYAGLVFERVFGSEEPATAERTRKPSGTENGRSEPEARSFRS